MPKVISHVKNLYVGVDSGASGGIAFVGPGVAVAICTPEDKRLAWKVFKDRAPACVFGVLEKVGGYVGFNQPGSAMFKFGNSYGNLEAWLYAAEIPFEEITPQAWMKGLGIASKPKDMAKKDWKKRLMAHAKMLFPNINVTLDTADALLIAEFCKRYREGTLITSRGDW